MENNAVMIIELAGAVGAIFTSLFIIYLKHKNTKGVKKLTDKLEAVDKKLEAVDKWNREEHKTLNNKLDELSLNYSAEKRIRKLAKDAIEMLDSSDRVILELVDTCVEVSVNFYSQLSIQPLKFNSEADVEKCSSVAISKVEGVFLKLEPEYVDVFRKPFVEKAVSIRTKFLEIFKDEMNGKEERFVRAIEDYLFEQLKLIVRSRIIYNAKK